MKNEKLVLNIRTIIKTIIKTIIVYLFIIKYYK